MTPQAPPHATRLVRTMTVATQAATGASPCDAFAAGGTPCVASFSTVRALYAS